MTPSLPRPPPQPRPRAWQRRVTGAAVRLVRRRLRRTCGALLSSAPLPWVTVASVRVSGGGAAAYLLPWSRASLLAPSTWAMGMATAPRRATCGTPRVVVPRCYPRRGRVRVGRVPRVEAMTMRRGATRPTLCCRRATAPPRCRPACRPLRRSCPISVTVTSPLRSTSRPHGTRPPPRTTLTGRACLLSQRPSPLHHRTATPRSWRPWRAP